MGIMRLFAVAFAAVAFIACTNAEPNVPDELETEPEHALTKGPKKDVPTDGSEGDVEQTTEQNLTGVPQSAPASGPAPSTSTSPLCGKYLTCSGVSVGGSKACRQTESSIGDVFCCPRIGDRIVDGVCVPKICASGLTCSASPTSGANTCRQTATSTSDVYCCPFNWRIQNGQCVPPICGTGLTCSASPTVGAPSCRQTSTSTSNVYCCQTPGAKIIDGKCQ